MKKDKKKKDKPVNKTPELSKAKKALDTYLKENNLNPQLDWSKDKKHGKKVTELLTKLNHERDKVAAQYPEKDLKNEAKLVKIKHAKKEADKKAKAQKERKVTKYDYPQIEGREMTSDEKKKYRMEQRKLASGKTSKPAKEEKEKVEKPEKKAKKDKKAKDKKVKKEED